MLKREIGLVGAVMMGLGSILGTGVFVSIGIAAGITGPSVVAAIAIAALVATCNALSSAQLAASHPVSGGTYEYGYRYLHPSLGFLAGWMFLCAKSASAATAALGFAGYLSMLIGWQGSVNPLMIALPTVIALTVLVAFGIRQSNHANIGIVLTTMLSLIAFVAFGTPQVFKNGDENLVPVLPESGYFFLQATALMFVAYTGYGRIATLGEEVREPHKTIPRAIIVTMIVSAAIYIAVGLVAVSTIGAEALGNAVDEYATPLAVAASEFQISFVDLLIALGAMTAMLAVLLNLLLGLSRVVLAMGRRGDLPEVMSNVNATNGTPVNAVILVGLIIAGLVLVGDIKLAWSFSALTVLIYYAITNLSALWLSSDERLYPRWISVAGLVACLTLAAFVEPRIWLIGLSTAAIGMIWHAFRQKIVQSENDG